jgi:hypothetical protein
MLLVFGQFKTRLDDRFIFVQNETPYRSSARCRYRMRAALRELRSMMADQYISAKQRLHRADRAPADNQRDQRPSQSRRRHLEAHEALAVRGGRHPSTFERPIKFAEHAAAPQVFEIGIDLLRYGPRALDRNVVRRHTRRRNKIGQTRQTADRSQGQADRRSMSTVFNLQRRSPPADPVSERVFVCAPSGGERPCFVDADAYAAFRADRSRRMLRDI